MREWECFTDTTMYVITAVFRSQKMLETEES